MKRLQPFFRNIFVIYLRRRCRYRSRANDLFENAVVTCAETGDQETMCAGRGGDEGPAT